MMIAHILLLLLITIEYISLIRSIEHNDYGNYFDDRKYFLLQNIKQLFRRRTVVIYNRWRYEKRSPNKYDRDIIQRLYIELEKVLSRDVSLLSLSVFCPMFFRDHMELITIRADFQSHTGKPIQINHNIESFILDQARFNPVEMIADRILFEKNHFILSQYFKKGEA